MEGGCYCGKIRYAVSERPILKAQCHCRECQYISGGGPNFFMTVPSTGFAYLQGRPKTFTRQDLERPVTREFCDACGTHLTTVLRTMGLTVVKAGTLDQPDKDYRGPKMAIYMKDSQDYFHLPEGMPRFDGLPPRA